MSALASALARRLYERPDEAYAPGPTIGAFHASESRLRLLRAPNQVGKTYAGAWEGNRHSLEHPGSVGNVLIADLDNHYSEVCAKIWEVIARAELAPTCKYVEGKGFFTGGKRAIKYRNGSRWVFRGGKSDQMAGAGLTAHWGWCDEIPPRPLFNEWLRSLSRHRGPGWVTLTPVGRPVEWFRERVEGLDGRPAGDVMPDGSPMWAQFVPELSVVECWWMTDDQIEEITATTDPDEAPQRLRGEWEGPTSDRRLNGMSAERIIEHVPDGEWTVTVTMDHGEGVGREHAVLLYHDATRFVVVDEYHNPHATTPEEDAQGVAAMLLRNGLSLLHVDRWRGDVNSAGKLGAGASVNDEMERAFAKMLGTERCPFRIEKAAKGAGSVAYGERLLNYALHRGDLSMCERARVTVRCAWHYRGPKDEDRKHAIDALRYGLADVLAARPDYSRLYVRH